MGVSEKDRAERAIGNFANFSGEKGENYLTVNVDQLSIASGDAWKVHAQGKKRRPAGRPDVLRALTSLTAGRYIRKEYYEPETNKIQESRSFWSIQWGCR